MNELLSLRSLSEERATIVFTAVFILLLIIDSIIMYPHADSWYDYGNADEKEWSLEYENLLLGEQSSITLSDGDSDTITLEVAENFTLDGWMIHRITTLINYDESAFGDADCDTVSASLSFTPNTGEAPKLESREETVSDCSQIELFIEWHQPPNNASGTSAEEIKPEFGLEGAPISIDVDIGLNVDSTIPNNDNDEQVNIEIRVELIRIASVVQI